MIMSRPPPPEPLRFSPREDVSLEARPTTSIYIGPNAAAVDIPINGNPQAITNNNMMTLTQGSSVISASPSNGHAFTSYWQRSSRLATSQDTVIDITQSPQVYATPPLLSRHTSRDTRRPERSPSPPPRRSMSSAMSESVPASKSPQYGLIRRISRGAHNKLRRRASTTHSMRMRDQSAGPIIVRRRSDSNGASDFGQDVSDLELDTEANDEVFDETTYPTHATDRPNALGINPGRPSLSSTTALGSFEGGIAAATSAVLENGTWVTKVTKRRSKRVKLWLDSNSARVCWHLTNTSKSFFIDDVREVRIGADSRNARDDVQIPADQEGRWVTIVYDSPERSNGRTIKTMHVVMPDDFLLKLWTEALNTVLKERNEIMNALSSSPDKSEKSMKMAWAQAMARKPAHAEERFSLDDARWICRKLEINCSAQTVWTHFKSISDDEAATLDYDQFRSFIRTFRDRKDIQNVYRNMKMGTDLDTDLDTFLDFLKTDQGADIVKDRAYWISVFERFARPSTNRSLLPDATPNLVHRVLNPQSFQAFLTSTYNPALIGIRGEPPSLDKPLNEYFISSSHNTYLLGHQVRGTSSVEGYIAALVRGCRCVEIDCWDGEDGRPRVTHGRTLTTKIPFEDCVSVISKYAFNSSPYPLIISLEVHCNAEQQLVMVDLMKRYFGSAMVTEPLAPGSIVLPSPEELKFRILIKVKSSEEPGTPQLVADTPSGRSRARSLSSAFTARTSSTDSHSLVSSPSIPSSKITSPSDQSLSGITLTPSSSADDSDIAPITGKDKSKRATRITPDLGKLGVYTQGIKFTSFQEAKTFNHVFSFNERKFEDCARKATDSKALLEKHNTRYLMRVYPHASRFDSTNFNPLDAWKRGVQMAALNWQTFDVNQQINEAMFAAGFDRSGYVLKPEELRHAKHLPIADTIPTASEKKEKKGKKLVKFTVDVLSAQRLPRPRNRNPENGMNPYVEFEMFSAEDKTRGNAYIQGDKEPTGRDGMATTGSPLRKRTRVVEGNGFDPQYYQSITMTVETKYPSMIFVRWTVWNAGESKSPSTNSVLLATFTAKLSSLQQGYRHLPLFNPQGEQYRDAKLFVRIRKEAPIPLHVSDDMYGMLDRVTTNLGSASITSGGVSSVGSGQSPLLSSPRPEASWPKRLLGSVRKKDHSSGDTKEHSAGS